MDLGHGVEDVHGRIGLGSVTGRAGLRGEGLPLAALGVVVFALPVAGDLGGSGAVGCIGGGLAGVELRQGLPRRRSGRLVSQQSGLDRGRVLNDVSDGRGAGPGLSASRSTASRHSAETFLASQLRQYPFLSQNGYCAASGSSTSSSGWEAGGVGNDAVGGQAVQCLPKGHDALGVVPLRRANSRAPGQKSTASTIDVRSSLHHSILLDNRGAATAS